MFIIFSFKSSEFGIIKTFPSKVFNLVVLILISSTTAVVQSGKIIISPTFNELSASKIIHDKKFSIIDLEAIAIAKPAIPADASKGVILTPQEFSINKAKIENNKILAVIFIKLTMFFVIIAGNFKARYLITMLTVLCKIK